MREINKIITIETFSCFYLLRACLIKVASEALVSLVDFRAYSNCIVGRDYEKNTWRILKMEFVQIKYFRGAYPRPLSSAKYPS